MSETKEFYNTANHPIDVEGGKTVGFDEFVELPADGRQRTDHDNDLIKTGVLIPKPEGEAKPKPKPKTQSEGGS